MNYESPDKSYTFLSNSPTVDGGSSVELLTRRRIDRPRSRLEPGEGSTCFVASSKCRTLVGDSPSGSLIEMSLIRHLYLDHRLLNCHIRSSSFHKVILLPATLITFSTFHSISVVKMPTHIVRMSSQPHMR